MNILKNISTFLSEHSKSRGFHRDLARWISKTITDKNKNMSQNRTERLSPLVKPVHYDLVLNPELTGDSFKGTVNINLLLREQKDFIHLHSKYLNISDVKMLKGDQQFVVKKFLADDHLEQLKIHFDYGLCPGHYQLKIDFSGDLTSKIVGFYKSTLYNDRTMVASKFEPTYARQAFPCFDEPEFKATYDITLVKPVDSVALSNMNEISSFRDIQADNVVVKFATSVPMSTYLACFVICDFKHKEEIINANGIGNDFTMRTFAQKDQLHKIDFALDIGKRATEFYIQYYEVPFPLPKLDMIAIPDYQSGATEHWGLITYRETAFLIDQATASSSDKMSVANTIAHELAHMWFGNLVTMKWWNDLWLNEGFATYMQVKALHDIEPYWQPLDQYLPKTMHHALAIDAKLSSHPIVQTVNTPDEITAIFDSISYNKGSAVLRMLENFIGIENFRRGVSDYLQKFKYGNTITEDLLQCLEPYLLKDMEDISVLHIMDTWTRQMGYPVLTVEKENDNQVVITQSRFLSDPESAKKMTNDSPYNYRWFVPVTYKTSEGIYDEVLWFPDTTDNLSILLKPGEKWIKINNNQVGFYRVNYSEDMWNALIHELKQNSIQLTVSDRAHLINDAFALAESMLIPYSIPLELTTYLSNEHDYVPWQTACVALLEIEDKLRNTESAPLLKEYLRRLVEPVYNTLSWEKSFMSSPYDELFRTRILKLAARLELPDAMQKTEAIFTKWLSTGDRIDPEISEIVYSNGLKLATRVEWEKVLNILSCATDAQEMQKLRIALSTSSDKNILKQYLDWAWKEKNIRSQDYLSVVRHIANNPQGTKLVWDDMRKRWKELVDRFTLNSRYLGNLVAFVTENFNTEAQLEELTSFYEKNPKAGAGESARIRALESVQANVRWMKFASPAITNWLRKHTLPEDVKPE